MFSGKSKIYVLLLSFFAIPIFITAQNLEKDDNREALESGLRFLQRYFIKDTNWRVTDPETQRSVKGLLQFIDQQPLDSIQLTIQDKLNREGYRYVYRLPEHVADSLHVPGYYPAASLNRDMARIESSLYKKYFESDIVIPENVFADLEQKAGIIPAGKGSVLIEKGVYQLPDTLQLPDVVPDSLMHSPEDFRTFLRRDSIRSQVIEAQRQAYNDSVLNAYRREVIDNYRRQQFEQELYEAGRRKRDSVDVNNYQVLRQYNDSVMAEVNDSIAHIIAELVDYADFIDTANITMTNLRGEESTVFLQNNNPYYSRVWLKNEQNDSLRMLVKSTGKRSMQLLIDDGVTFSRFKPRETKEFDFSSLQQRSSGLTGVQEKYQVITPWRIGGDGNVGFTQTYLENWKSGGQSALSLQIVLKGYANYSRHDGKVKWENSSEIRNGYIRPGGEGAELQKNDDRFLFTSRFGVSAFKKWYYSTELNFETQFFNGYKYPKSANPDPISGFLSPARTFFKIGLDYKPNNNFSLLLSPITAKNVFVKDTARINQVNFGIEPDKRSMWEPGLNTDIFFRKNINADITYETKYKMFVNYLEPKGNLDINWENVVIMKLTDNINMRLLIHMIYDENVLFPVHDANGVVIDNKPKVQLREFFTIGFAYKINRQVTRTRRK